jgi:hypothetical protein
VNSWGSAACCSFENFLSALQCLVSNQAVPTTTIRKNVYLRRSRFGGDGLPSSAPPCKRCLPSSRTSVAKFVKDGGIPVQVLAVLGNFHAPPAFALGLRYRYPYAVPPSQKAELLRG